MPEINKVVYGNTTLIDLTDTTAEASDVAQGKYFYGRDGVKTAGTATGGGDVLVVTLSKNSNTGYWEPNKTWAEVTAAVSGNKTIVVDTAGNFEEVTADGTYDSGNSAFLYKVTEVDGDETSYWIEEQLYLFDGNGVNQIAVYKDYDTSNADATASDVLGGKVFYTSAGLATGSIASKTSSDLTANNLTVTAPAGYYASSASKTLTDANLVAGNVKNGVTIFGVTGSYAGGPSATQHVIHLEFTDSTDTDINVYYDDSLLGTMITAYGPDTWTYSSKTVDSAALDNTTWYQRQTATWETLYEDNEANFISDTPYNYLWLSSLSNVYPTAGSVWRVTIDNSTYQCTAALASTSGGNITCFGNPKYSGGTDNGSDAPFNMYNAGWGALMGDTEVTAGNHYMKIERQVSA